MSELDPESKYRTEVKPVDPVGGEAPAKFMKLLASNKNDPEMRVYTVLFHPVTDDDEDDAPPARRSSGATMALVTVEFGAAVFQDWNKTDLAILEHDEAFQEMAIRAVERVHTD